MWEGNPDRPFCSERCRMIDLGHWASGDYAVPGAAVDPDAVESASLRSNEREDD